MNNDKLPWREFFLDLAPLLRAAADVRLPLQPDRSGPPDWIAFHRGFASFPFATKVWLLDTDGAELPGSEGRYWTVIYYDFTRPHSDDIQFLGIHPLRDVTPEQLLAKTESNADPEFIRRLEFASLAGLYGDHNMTDVARYDVRDRPVEYARSLVDALANSMCGFDEWFKKKVDLREEYQLSSDPILEKQDLLRGDSISVLFAGDEPVSELQERVAEIQLIPQVPESIHRVIRVAKDLYIFGYFRYPFFTVALHYAYAAMEGALHARWSAMLPSPTTISYHPKGGPVQTHQLDHPSHAAIRHWCERQGWKLPRVRVNDQAFPVTAKHVLQALHEAHVITDWQRWRFQELWLKLRNSHSHMEFSPIHSPECSTIASAVNEINDLFRNLPLPKKGSA